MRAGGQGTAGRSVRIAEHNPNSGAIDVVITGADCAGELDKLERQRGGMSEVEIGVLGRIRLVRRMSEDFHQDAAGVIDKIAKTLGDENHVDVARGRLLELFEVVIGQRSFEWNFDGGVGLIFIGSDANGHSEYVGIFAGWIAIEAGKLLG